jgi:Cys-tRNA(Pro) deacylase
VDLEGFLKRQGVAYELVRKKTTVHTSDAAAVTGIRMERLTKSLVCIGSDGKAYVAIIPGTRRLRPKEVARALGLKKVTLCPAEKAHKYSGYPPGATPPVHYRAVTGVVVDDFLLQFDEIYGGGGTNELLVKMRTGDVVRLNGAIVRSISGP